jgi:Arc/MetJ family transcription regulator
MSARRFSVTLDPDLLDEAVRITGAGSQREAIETALEELVRRRRLDALAARAGRVPLTVTVDDLLREREEG